MVAWTRSSSRRSPVSGGGGANGYEETPRGRARGALRSASPTLGRGARRRSRSPARGSFVPSPPRWRSRPRPSRRLRARADARRRPCAARWRATSCETAARARSGRSYLVNAAGLHSDEIDAMLGHGDFTVTPRRGELIVFDKLARGLVNHILLPVPTAKTKGVLVSPTVYGNVLLGPTADDIDDKTDRSTTAAGLAALLERGRADRPRLVRARGDRHLRGPARGDRGPRLPAQRPRRAALRLRRRHPLDRGLRARWRSPSTCARASPTPGLRSAARAATDRSCACRTSASSAPALSAGRADQPTIPSSAIVCFCERVTRGEIERAIGSPIPPGRPRRPAAPHARADGPLPGVLLRAVAGSVDAAIRSPRSSMGDGGVPDGVVIVGGGPSGLAGGDRAAPARDRPRDRDRARARGRRDPAPLRTTPASALRDLRTVSARAALRAPLRGPGAADAGVELVTETMVTDWEDGRLSS